MPNAAASSANQLTSDAISKAVTSAAVNLNLQQQKMPDIKIVNVQDHQAIDNYMSGPQGERIILNHYRRNEQQIRGGF